MNTTFVNAFTDEMEKLGRLSKKEKALWVSGGAALGLGGILLSRGRSAGRASSAVRNATKGAKNLKPKIEQQTKSIQVGNQKAEKLLRESKAQRAHTDSMLKKMKTQEATFAKFDKSMKDPNFTLKL